MPPHVLIVEDDSDLRSSLTALLELEGFQVATAEHGRAALDYLSEQEHPKVILLDLTMPVMGGLEFREVQLRSPEFSRIPVVVLSASQEIEKNTARLQAQHYIKKPVDIDRLLAVLRQFT